MSVGSDWALSKNQAESRVNELDVAGEARLYRAFRHFWHPVMYSHELGTDPARVTLCGEQLVAVRLDDKLSVFNDLCAHRGTALSLGKVVDGPSGGQELRCPYHGWQFNRQGNCTLAPQRPDLAGHLRARVKSYNVAEKFDLIWVCLVDEPHYPLPEFPEYDDPDFYNVLVPTTTWKCSAPRRTENYSDLSHFAIVHDGYLGYADHPAVPPHNVWREEAVGQFCMDIEGPMLEPRSIKNAGVDVEGDVVRVRKAYRLHMPLTVRLTTVAEGRYCTARFFHPTPVDSTHIRNFTVVARNFGSENADKVADWMQLVYEQDRPVVESQRPESLPEDLSFEMHLHGVDTFSVHYRKWLVDLANELGSDN